HYSSTPPPPYSHLLPYTTLFRSAPTTLPDELRQAASYPSPIRPQVFSECEATRRKWHFVLTKLRNDDRRAFLPIRLGKLDTAVRSEEHTSELQSRVDLVCRLLLE